MTASLDIREVTQSNFGDLERLFGPSGAYYGCWCMYRRLTRKRYESSSPEQRKELMCSLVDSGEVPGLLLYESGMPAGWVSIAPVEQFKGLFGAYFRKPREGSGLWTTSCFFVARNRRGNGYMGKLLEAAIEYVREKGGTGIIASPVRVGSKTDSALLFTGKVSTFKRSGFKEVEAGKSSKDRKIMILSLKK